MAEPSIKQDEEPAAIQGAPAFKTVQEALELLESIKEKISDELKPRDGDDGTGDGKLWIPLNMMGVLQTEKNKMAHILWVGPAKSNVLTPLDRVASASSSFYLSQ